MADFQSTAIEAERYDVREAVLEGCVLGVSWEFNLEFDLRGIE